MYMDIFATWIQRAGILIDLIGVAIIILGILGVSARSLLPQKVDAVSRYSAYRRDVGKITLLGLELLVAGDIIRSVAVTPTLNSVSVLGLIVIIRTLLSFSLEIELEGSWFHRRRLDD